LHIEARVTGAGESFSEYSEALPELALRAWQELANECRFEYDPAKSILHSKTLSFYPKGTWQCRLELRPQVIRVNGKPKTLKAATNYYFLFQPDNRTLPLLPLGNDTEWILRANKHHGLNLRGRIRDDDELLLNPVSEANDAAMMRRVIEYLHFYYDFTHYDAYSGGPMRFRVPRRLDDLQIADDVEEERHRLGGALWRFLDLAGTNAIRPALRTITRFINRYQADIPLQVGSFLWRLRVSISLRSGHVRLFGRVPFYYSPHLQPPSADKVETLPVPRGLYWYEPWLWLPERLRASIAALAYFALTVSWLLATLLAVSFPLTYLLHPAVVEGVGRSVGQLVPIGLAGLWWSALYSLGIFAFIAAAIFQFDGVLRRATRAAPSVLQASYRMLSRFQRWVWDRFKPNLETPWKKTSTAVLWLLASTLLLIAEFTTLQIAQEPDRFANAASAFTVMQTFAGHATIAFPGLPYVLGALGVDPLRWLKDPSMTSLIVLGFRIMMLIVVFRAFWKLLGYTSPRVLYRDNRRLEVEIAGRSSRPGRTRPRRVA
jgi:hypothetical protein